MTNASQGLASAPEPRPYLRGVLHGQDEPVVRVIYELDDHTVSAPPDDDEVTTGVGAEASPGTDHRVLGKPQPGRTEARDLVQRAGRLADAGNVMATRGDVP